MPTPSDLQVQQGPDTCSGCNGRPPRVVDTGAAAGHGRRGRACCNGDDLKVVDSSSIRVVSPGTISCNCDDL